MTHIFNWMHPDVTAILEIVQKFVKKQIYVSEVFVYVQTMPLTSQKEDAILELEVSYVLLHFGGLRKLIIYTYFFCKLLYSQVSNKNVELKKVIT